MTELPDSSLSGASALARSSELSLRPEGGDIPRAKLSELPLSEGAPPFASMHDLVLASRGDPLTTFLFDALIRRFLVAGIINPDLSLLQRYAVAALTYRPSRSSWVERFYKSSTAGKFRSGNATRRLRALRTGRAVVFQVHALFSIGSEPSVVYIDCTHAQSAALWPAWNPLRGRTLQVWYRREQAIYDSAKHLFAFSAATKTSLTDDYGIDPAKITVTGAGVNFLQLPELPLLGRERPEGPPIILFIGNDFVRKGGEILLAAFELVRGRIPDARLQLVGLDPKIASQAGVEVLGRIDNRSRIAELYASAAVFVVPSFFDPFPLVALEAMAFGVPVIASNQMGTPEMITDHRTGRLVEPGNVEALANALLELLLDRDRAEGMAIAARQQIETEFTWDAVVERMAPVLTQLGAIEATTS
jgi:starch synthase